MDGDMNGNTVVQYQVGLFCSISSDSTCGSVCVGDGGYCRDAVCYSPVQEMLVGNAQDTFTFDPIGYEENCETRVRAVAPNCVSDPDFRECSTYIECPEVPEVECALIVDENDTTGTILQVTIPEPSTGNIDHVATWNLEYMVTVEGPRICVSSSGVEVACDRYIPTFGLAGCDQTIAEACGDTEINEDFGTASTSLWEACANECNMIGALSETIDGLVL